MKRRKFIASIGIAAAAPSVVLSAVAQTPPLVVPPCGYNISTRFLIAEDIALKPMEVSTAQCPDELFELCLEKFCNDKEGLKEPFTELVDHVFGNIRESIIKQNNYVKINQR